MIYRMTKAYHICIYTDLRVDGMSLLPDYHLGARFLK